MIFFTRKLYDEMQADTRGGTRALREWDRRAEAYRRYGQVVLPLVPKAVARLGREGLHDATIVSAVQRARRLTLIVDTTHALTRIGRRGHVRLVFHGVRGKIDTRRLARAWWCYEEVHLSSRARFALHVLFHRGELEIEADDLVIRRVSLRTKAR
jgi:hypothetical protein